MTTEDRNNETTSDILDTSMMSQEETKAYAFGNQTYKNRMSKSGRKRNQKIEEEHNLLQSSRPSSSPIKSLSSKKKKRSGKRRLDTTGK